VMRCVERLRYFPKETMENASKQRLAEALQRLVGARDDEGAWKIVYELAWGTGLAVANQVLRGQLELAKDVTQEAFQRIICYGRFEHLQDPEKFLAYFRTVCRNVARDALKRLAPELASGLSLEEFENLRPRGNETATPEQILRAQQLKDQLLNDLNPVDRDLFTMLINGRSLDEIALALDLSYQNAGVRVHRLREALRNKMIQRGL
jgi:RNA polymerase sigma factor (sigma-70 family)